MIVGIIHATCSTDQRAVLLGFPHIATLQGYTGNDVKNKQLLISVQFSSQMGYYKKQIKQDLDVPNMQVTQHVSSAVLAVSFTENGLLDYVYIHEYWFK